MYKNSNQLYNINLVDLNNKYTDKNMTHSYLPCIIFIKTNKRYSFKYIRN
jgi:hypothetical protein